MTPDELEALILEGSDPWDVQKALAGLDEKQRAKLSPAAQKLFNQLLRSRADKGASDRLKSLLSKRSKSPWHYWNSRETGRATLALFGVGPVSAVKKRDARARYEDWLVFERIIADRRPEWLDDWVAHDLESEFSHLRFGTLRTWIRSGICRKPEVDGYYRMLALHLMRTREYPGNETAPPISAQLLDDRDLLADIDGLFRVENFAFNTNSWLTTGAAENYETLTDALVKLSAQGHIERERLLILALSGLTLDLKQNQLAGFHDFYKRMEPTTGELQRHQPEFIALLCHPVGHVAKFAIDRLAELEKSGALDTDSVLREIPTVFAGGAKGNAKAALKLVERLMTRQADAVPAALDALGEALRHVQIDVQSQALDILEKNAARLDSCRLAALADLETFVAASNRKRLAALLATAAPGERDAQDVAPEVAAPAGPQPAEPSLGSSYQVGSNDIAAHEVLYSADELQPVGSVDELIDLVLHTTEIVHSPDDLERIIGAISRFANHRPDDFEDRVAPLLYRLRKGQVGMNGMAIGRVGVGLALLDLIYTWATGQLYRTPSQANYHTQENAFVPMIAHLRAITERVAAKQGQVLLSTPTHKGGWIDPLAWVERLRNVQHRKDIAETMDLRLSLLRLAPDNREAALNRATKLDTQVRRIAIFALGGDERPAKADRKNHAAWISAARCRDPYRDWRADFAPLDLDDAWPDSLAPARYAWRSSSEKGEAHGFRWTTPKLAIEIACDGAPGAPERASGFGAKVVQLAGWRTATDWAELPSAAAHRRSEDRPSWWSGELNTTWVAQWLAYIWPQNPAASHIKGAANLMQRMDENSSNWTPNFGYFQALFQRGRPWREPGHLLLCLGLIGKDADAKGLAVDALIEGIDGRLFDPDLFAATITGLAQGEWVKFNRLADALMAVLQASELHATVVAEALQMLLPGLDFRQKNTFRLLEVLVEAQAVARLPLDDDAKAALRKIGGSGKAARIARRLLD